MLMGCGEAKKEEVLTPTTQEVSKEAEEELENQEKEIEARGKVIVDTTFICENPIEKTLFTKNKDWMAAITSTDVKALKEQEENYDSDFFENNVLCYIPQVSSSGMEYQLENVSFKEVEGKNLLTVYVSYSTDKILDTMCSYAFFVEFDKEEVSEVDEIILEEYER